MAGSQQAMEYIWERLPKQKDGETIRYLKADLDYLYFNGFVDSRKFKIEIWKKAFKKFAQKDGTFVLTEKQFMALRLFRYDGRSDEVFDPFKLKEGPWPDKSLEKLYHNAIAKSSEITHITYWVFVNKLKELGRVDENGDLVVDKAFMLGMDVLINKFPSPRRRLEIEVKRLREERSGKTQAVAQQQGASDFTVGKSEEEVKKDQFKDFLSTKSASQSTVEEPVSDEDTIDIKSLRKPKGTFRG